MGASSAVGVGPGGWDHLGDSGTPGTKALDGPVRALSTGYYPGVLLVGGGFTNAGGKPDLDHIAFWTGSNWGPVGTGLPGDVFAIAHADGKIYAGGSFTNAGGNADADFLAVYDGVSWAPFCVSPGTPIQGNVKALQIIGSTLYVGGEFQNGAGIAAADYLLACDLNTGTPSATVSTDGDFTGGIAALTADTAGNLYAAGTFINLDNIPAADYVAAYNGGTWSAMGSGSPGAGAVNGISRALAANGTDVYLGTDAVDVAGIPQADHVAKWNGSAWSAVGSDTSGANGWFPAATSINGLTTLGSRVLATGAFQNADGNPAADEIASFDGTSWQPVGSNGAGDGPLPAVGHVVITFDQNLYVGGNFTSAGGDAQAQFAASYPLSPPPPPPVPPPTLTLSGSKSQRLGATIAVEVSCDAACSATATGSLNVPHLPKKFKVDKFKLREVTKPVAAGSEVKLKLKVPKAARNPAKNALESGKKVTAKISVEVSDTTGGSSSGKRTIKLKP